MEINQQPTSQIHNQRGSEEQAPSPTQPRLYECTFCKKGFSNAQALGGHMNIHRKDKAKLKQASKENQRLLHQDNQGMTNEVLTPSSKPLEFTTWPPSTFSSHHDQEDSYQLAARTDESHMAEIKQLPLFVETASRVAGAPDYSYPINNIQASTYWQEDYISDQGSFGADLDLELRLGHEPPKSSIAIGTRKFF